MKGAPNTEMIVAGKMETCQSVIVVASQDTSSLNAEMNQLRDPESKRLWQMATDLCLGATRGCEGEFSPIQSKVNEVSDIGSTGRGGK